MQSTATRIYHVTERHLWNGCDYRADSPAAEGFIHCSLYRQLPAVLTTLFTGDKDLIVLEVSTLRLSAAVRYEFPHLYGPIPADAVVDVLDVQWTAPGAPVVRRHGVDSSIVVGLARAESKDLDTLAELNRCLQEDEGCEVLLDHLALTRRMETWIASGHEGWLLLSTDAPPRILGYALVDIDAAPHLLRHYYVERGARRLGIGARGLQMLIDRYSRESSRLEALDVEARVGNEAARRFWHRMKFRELSVRFRRTLPCEVKHDVSDDQAATRTRAITGNTDAAATFILDNLKAHNDKVSPYHRHGREPGAVENIAVMLEDSTGAWVGGICASVHWGWLDIEDFWIAEAYRGQGHGRSLMSRLEALAVAKGAERALLSTFSFQARGLYEKLGYRVVGEMSDFPPGESLYWMRKDRIGAWPPPKAEN